MLLVVFVIAQVVFAFFIGLGRTMHSEGEDVVVFGDVSEPTGDGVVFVAGGELKIALVAKRGEC